MSKVVGLYCKVHNSLFQTFDKCLYYMRSDHQVCDVIDLIVFDEDPAYTAAKHRVEELNKPHDVDFLCGDWIICHDPRTNLDEQIKMHLDSCSKCKEIIRQKNQGEAAKGPYKFEPFDRQHLKTCGTAFRGCDPQCMFETEFSCDEPGCSIRIDRVKGELLPSFDERIQAHKNWHKLHPNLSHDYCGHLPQDKALRFNEGKPRMSLLSPIALEGLAEVFSYGAKKYADHNWRKGLHYSNYIDSLLRHLCAFMRGEDVDPESGLPHIDHVQWNAHALSEVQKTRDDLDDRYKIGE